MLDSLTLTLTLTHLLYSAALQYLTTDPQCHPKQLALKTQTTTLVNLEVHAPQ